MYEIQLFHSYDLIWFVGSLLIACFSGYVVLRLLRRVRQLPDSQQKLPWWIAASLAMGIGIWSMHFTGMLALKLPVPVGYTPGLTFLSLIIAIVVSAFALWLVQYQEARLKHLAGGAVLMGIAIAGMHYTGMAAMRLPGTMSYHLGWFITSIVVAIGAAGAALGLFIHYHQATFQRIIWSQIIGGITLGIAVSGLHYTGMVAVRFHHLNPGAALQYEGLIFGHNLALWVFITSSVLLGLGLLAAFLDRYSQTTYAQELERSKNRYEAILAEISDVVTLTDQKGRIQYESPSIEAVFGYPAQRWNDRSFLTRIHPRDREDVRQTFREILDAQKRTKTVQYRLKHNNGTWRTVESTLVVPQTSTLDLLITTRDVTHRKQVEQKYQTIFSTNPSAVALSTIPDNRFVEVNPALTELLGYSAEELIGKRDQDLNLWVSQKQFQQITDAIEKEGAIQNVEATLRHKKGHVVEVLFSASVLETGDEQYVLAVAQDITERKQFQQALKHQALHDQLTQLPNRTLFHDRLQHALQRDKRQNSTTGVLFVDLDRFKVINDSLGHAAGDQVLQSVGGRLQELLRDQDTIARVGGDEFAILLEDVNSPEEIKQVVERIRKVFKVPFEINDTSFSLSASIGAAHSNLDFNQPDDLIRLADAAMYRVKDTDGTNFHVFEPSQDEEVTQRLQRENALRRAIEQEELSVQYQPIYELKTQKIVGVEALVRWEHPVLGLVGPEEFIPRAEDTGLIVPLEEYVLSQTFHDYQHWKQQVLIKPDHPLSLSVNISAHQFNKGNLENYISKIAHETEMDLSSLVLEITETAAMATGATTFQELQKQGIQLAIDDFGTGYSSLEYLRYFQADLIKIDRSFVENLHTPDYTAELVRGVLFIARSMGVDVVAEGIETTQQLEWLKEHNCPYGQGFLMNHPMPPKEIAALLE